LSNLVAPSWTTTVTVEQLASELKNPHVVVVDCRFSLADPRAGHRAYLAGHIPGARFADLDEDLSGTVTQVSGRHPLPAPEALAARLGDWGIDDRVQVVAYDHGPSAFAARLWWLLGWLGHTRVAVLDGGLAAWEAAGQPSTCELPHVVGRTFHPEPDDARWIGSPELARQVVEGTVTLVDAREPDRYRGEVEPIDPVAGHVPGAVNRPFRENVTADGCFLPAENLSERFSQLAAGVDEKTVVHMCGSGVTACHNLLAMTIAGLPAGQLYAGSWSEWIRDPRRPVETFPIPTSAAAPTRRLPDNQAR
jgi:thiosulfate/3-mercaptopyruvate sulfurtransferase